MSATSTLVRANSRQRVATNAQLQRERPHPARPASDTASNALAHWFGDAALAHAAPGIGPLVADHMLALQQASGNAAVARLVAEHQRAQRAPADQCEKFDPRAICDELHLRADFWGPDRNDGSRLDRAFHNNRPLTASDNGPDVKKFQEALIQVGFALPKFGADGKWGDETKRAVARFQAANGIEPGGFEAGRKTLLAVDAHLAGAPGPKPPTPVPPTPVPPTPQPGQGDAELEVVLDRIDVAYQLMITRERDGVQALSRDLTNLDQPKPSDLAQIINFMLMVIAAGLYGLSEGALRKAIKGAVDKIDALSDPVKDDIDNANDKVFDGIQDRYLKVAPAQGGAEGRADLLADFSDKQLEAVTNAGFGAADTFESQGKPQLRKGGTPQPPVLGTAGAGGPTPDKHDPRNQSGDPRVDKALAMLDSVNSVANQAFQFHYDASLRAWDSKLAQAKAGADSKNANDTNLEGMQVGNANPGQGILRVLLEILSGPVEQVVAAKIDGLSPRVRTKLTGKKPADIKFPVVADGSTGSRTMRIGITEHQRMLDLTTSSSGAQFLTQRGNGDRRAGVVLVANTVLNTPLPNVDSA